MVKKNILQAKLEHIERHLIRLAQYGSVSYAAFLENQEIQDIVEYNLFQSINHLIAMIEHIVVDENYGLPQTAYEGVEILRKKKIFSVADCVVIRKMIGFRNVVGHDYIHLDKKIVHQILVKGTRDVKRLTAKLVKKFL